MYTTWPFAVSLHSPTNWSPWNQFSVLMLFQEWPSELFLMDPSVWGPWAVQFLSLPAHPAVRNPFASSLLPPSELRILWQACYSLASIPQIWEFVEISCCLLLLCVLAACFFLILGLPSWPRWLRICLQCRRPEFDSWVGKISFRREWQPTPVFLPGEFNRQRSLAGYSSWGYKELGMTEWLNAFTFVILAVLPVL